MCRISRTSFLLMRHCISERLVVFSVCRPESSSCFAEENRKTVLNFSVKAL